MTRLILAGVCAATTVALGAAALAQQLPGSPAKAFGTSIWKPET
jgi:Spy/CpxP family protein refolding chaperone